jgi:hypothetical protein
MSSLVHWQTAFAHLRAVFLLASLPQIAILQYPSASPRKLNRMCLSLRSFATKLRVHYAATCKEPCVLGEPCVCTKQETQQLSNSLPSPSLAPSLLQPHLSLSLPSTSFKSRKSLPSSIIGLIVLRYRYLVPRILDAHQTLFLALIHARSAIARSTPG